MGNRLSATKNNRTNSSDLESGCGISGSGKKVVVDRPLWRRVLNRVPPRLRENKEHVYDPSVLSLGPYHHGQPHLCQLEEFKDDVVNIMLKEDEIRLLFRGKILERIDDIRHFYGGLSRDGFNDDVLADMMLRDACTLLYWMELNAWKDHRGKAMLVFKHLGLYHAFLVGEDVLKLENQIPWWLMKSLISLTYDDDNKKGKELIRRVFQAYGNSRSMKQILWYENEDYYRPLHFLEAICNTSLIAADKIESSTGGMLQPGKRSFRSVAELKAKGIYFKPTSHSLTDISFKSYNVFGVLHLPVLAVTKESKVALSNIMALEMCPGTPCTDLMVTSYLTFMKSMIESPEDVKFLQEKGIIVSFLEDNEEIVRMFKEMDTFGIDTFPIYNEIKIRINHHCNSKAKTWIAELINTNFRSPWTVVTILAATLLLCLTFLQTYYTINPK